MIVSLKRTVEVPEPASKDDLLEATKMQVAFSTSQHSTTVPICLAALALITFVLARHETSFIAFPLWALGGESFFIGAWIGGLGIVRVTLEGSRGNWSLKVGQKYFWAQAALLSVGMVFILGGLIVELNAPLSDHRSGPDLNIPHVLRTDQIAGGFRTDLGSSR